MYEPTKYQYSLKFSIGTLVLMLLMMLILLNNVMATNNAVAWIIFGVFSAFFISMVSLLVSKRLIPAIKGNIALELTDTTLIDYIRNITIDWKDIKDIELVRGRSASTILIDLKWESDYGSQIAIPLRWVKGKDDDIYDMVIAYFEQEPGIE
jgi:hypothetical protein